jgi:starch synthase
MLGGMGLHNEGYYCHPDRLQDNFHANAINFMKGGIVYSNYVNTVSPHHAWEARFGDVGYGLSQTLGIHHDKFGGILNGIDYNIWNPEIDDFIPHHYGIGNFEDKAKNKKALRDRLLLRDENKPIACYIGRLDQQKGVHLVHHAIYYTLNRGGQFVLLGSATANDINSWFWHEKNFLNDNPDVHIELGFDEELSHLIYAGADMIVVPSNYEPCGLTQMISLKYGTVPIVRGVGGLVNTVFDRDYDELHLPEQRNGYVFFNNDPPALESAMGRAFELWYTEPEKFQEMAIAGMNYDYSWKDPVDNYLSVYEHIRYKEV